jgi:hypothetical protein
MVPVVLIIVRWVLLKIFVYQQERVKEEMLSEVELWVSKDCQDC